MKKLALLIIILFSLVGVKKADAQVAVSVEIAPPELPDYAQPPCPTDGYLWSPGYWGENVGFYGGVCYGYGYGGSGFYGGRWQGGRFQYNTAAWHVGRGMHNTYEDRTVIHNNSNRSSFNGHGGTEAQPTDRERGAMSEHHTQPTSAQQNHQQMATANKHQLATANGGHPATTARSNVGGERFNSSGHSISTIHAARNAGPAATANHSANNNHTAMQQPANVSHGSAPRSQPQPQQRSAAPSRPAQQPQHQNSAPQRQAQPSRGAQGGGHMGGGGGGGHAGGGGGRH